MSKLSINGLDIQGFKNYLDARKAQASNNNEPEKAAEILTNIITLRDVLKDASMRHAYTKDAIEKVKNKRKDHPEVFTEELMQAYRAA